MNPILSYLKSPVKRPITLNCMNDKITLWADMYENNSPWLNDDVTGLNLAAAISSELARLVTIEMQTAVSGSERAEYLENIYRAVAEKARNFTEVACAKGAIVLKPYVKDREICIDYIHPEDFMPLEFDGDGKITGAAFCDRVYKDGKVYTRVEEHRLTDRYIIKNKGYVSRTTTELGKEIPLGEVEEWSAIEPYAEISGIRKPLFAYFKMPFSNAFDGDSPLGVSVYARAVDLIKDADILYSELLWEFESGKRALFIDESALTRDKLGRKIIPDSRLYRMLSTDDDTLFKDWTPTLRFDEINGGLNRILRAIEFNIGLAYGTISDAGRFDRTAEEIRASMQRSYAMVTDIQRALKNALEQLVCAMDIWCSIYHLAPEGNYSVSFDFDDSIIADRKTEFEEKMRLLDAGVMLPWEFRSWYFGEEEDCAKAMLLGKKKEDKND